MFVTIPIIYAYHSGLTFSIDHQTLTNSQHSVTLTRSDAFILKSQLLGIVHTLVPL